jgi:hypothetical protein
MRTGFLARLAPELQPDPSPFVAQRILLEAKEAGLDPKILYEQAVAARPSEWPLAPSYEEVMHVAEGKKNGVLAKGKTAGPSERVMQLLRELFRRPPMEP